MVENEKIIDNIYRVIRTLGKGMTSKVVLAEHLKTGEKVAIKIYKEIKKNEDLIKSFNNEVEVMQNIKHENLIKIISANPNGHYFRTGKKTKVIIYIVVEFAENAELFDFISDPGKKFSEPLARFYFIQLMNGLKALHENKVSHRDLKIENIFLDGKFNLKIGDFGFSKEVDKLTNDGKFKTNVGSGGYKCPELLEGQSYNGESNDIFSCGVILFIMVNGFPPFKEALKNDMRYRHIYQEKYDAFWNSLKCSNSKKFKDLINGILKAKDRMTIDEILKSEWVKCDMENLEEIILEMKSRKLIVDRRREEKNTVTIHTPEKNEKTIYRGCSNNQVFYSLSKELNESGYLEQNQRKWDDRSSKYTFRFKGFEAETSFLNFISVLSTKNPKLKLCDEKLGVHVEVKYSLYDDDEEELDSKEVDLSSSSENLLFSAFLYFDLKNSNTIIELIKDKNTDAVIFRKFYDEVHETLSI